jgi:hypothetical protein
MTGSSEESTSWVAAAVNGASALASSAITFLKGDPRTELMMKGSEASSDTVVNSDEAIETGPAAAAPPAPTDSNGGEGGSPVIAPEARSVPLLDTDDYARQLETPFVEAFGTAPTFYVRAPGKPHPSLQQPAAALSVLRPGQLVCGCLLPVRFSC